MRVIEKLLDQVDPQTIKNYESQTQLHLKQILTTINKHKLEDTTQVNIRKYQCYTNCYDYYRQGIPKDKQEMIERVEQLRSCKQKCGLELKQVEKFLDNINFYSKKKFGNCSKDCNSGTFQDQNNCLWECYNRLDRRYKEYWANQRQNVEARHKI